jgi:hypothetical protein
LPETRPDPVSSRFAVLANALVRDRRVREAFPDGIVWVGVGGEGVAAWPLAIACSTMDRYNQV